MHRYFLTKLRECCTKHVSVSARLKPDLIKGQKGRKPADYFEQKLDETAPGVLSLSDAVRSLSEMPTLMLRFPTFELQDLVSAPCPGRQIVSNLIVGNPKNPEYQPLVRSFKRLRDFLGVRESKACSSCSKVASCPFAYKIPNVSYDGDVQDVFNVLLAYGQLADKIDPSELQNLDQHLEKLWEEERKTNNLKPGESKTMEEDMPNEEITESMRLVRDYGLKFQSCLITLRTLDKLLQDLETGIESELKLQQEPTQTQSKSKKKPALKVDFPLQKFDNAIREYEATLEDTSDSRQATWLAARGSQNVTNREKPSGDWRSKFTSSIKKHESDDSITGVKTERREELARKLKEDWSPVPQVIEGDRLYKRQKQTKDSYLDKVKMVTSNVVESNFLKKADMHLNLKPQRSERRFEGGTQQSREGGLPYERKEQRRFEDSNDRPRRPLSKFDKERKFSQGRFQQFEDREQSSRPEKPEERRVSRDRFESERRPRDRASDFAEEPRKRDFKQERESYSRKSDYGRRESRDNQEFGGKREFRGRNGKPGKPTV